MLCVPTLVRLRQQNKFSVARQTNGFFNSNFYKRKVLDPEADNMKDEDNLLFKAVAKQNLLGNKKKKRISTLSTKEASASKTGIEDSTELIDKIIELKTKSYLLQETSQKETNNRIFYSKFYIYEFITALLSLFSVIDIEIYFDLTFNYEGNDNTKPYGYLLLFLNITSVLFWLNNLLYAYDQFKLKLLNHLLAANTKFINTSYFKDFLVIFGVTFIQPCQLFSGYKYSIGTSYKSDIKLNRSINYILSILVLTRIIYIDRFIIFQTSYMTPDNDEICRKHFFKASYKYALISLLKTNPFHVYVMLIISFLYAFQFIIKVFESSVNQMIPSAQLNDTFNIIYYCFITIFTTGYGDMAAKTTGGRVAVFIISILGSFMISLFLMSLTSIVEFSQIEKKNFNLIKQTSLLTNKQVNAKELMNYVTKVWLNKNRKTEKFIKNKKNLEFDNFVDDVQNKNPNSRKFFEYYSKFKISDSDLSHQLSEINNYDFENIGFESQYFDKEYQKMNDDDKNNIKSLKKLLNKLDKIKRKHFIANGLRVTRKASINSRVSFHLSNKLLNGMLAK